jgi:hypothetical protein
VTVAESEPLAAKTAATKPDWWKRRYTFTGTAVGLVFLLLSMTPSLLPRGPLFQGIVSGAAGAIGYGLGVFAVWLIRFMRSQPASPPAPRWAWPILVVAGALALGMGLTTLLPSLWLRIPVVTAWSTPGAALLAVSQPGVPLPEAIGAFLACAVLLTVAGASGLFERWMGRIPMSIASPRWRSSAG